MKARKLIYPFVPALVMALLFYALPSIAHWIAADEMFRNATRQSSNIARAIQSGLIYPFGKWLPTTWEYILVFPYWLIVFSIIGFFYKKTKKFWKWVFIAFLSLYLFFFIFPDTLLWLENSKPSISSGTVSNGNIKNAKRIPLRGNNYTTYSYTCYLLGRTFVHDKVKHTVLDAYSICEESCPNKKFLLGETGHRRGGSFLPHRTHRNGLSVDFMTPLLNGKNNRVKLHYFNYHLFNLWGYGMDFDNNGNGNKGNIDYETTAKHILALEKAANKNGLRIQKIIFHPSLRKKLLATVSGKKISHLPYTKNPVIIRHDDHYHIDFAVK